MNPAAYLVLSAILFSTGLLGFLIRRNALDLWQPEWHFWLECGHS